MPDPENPGQFGNRDDTQEQAEAGGEANANDVEDTSSYDAEDTEEPSDAELNSLEDDENDEESLDADEDLGDGDSDTSEDVT